MSARFTPGVDRAVRRACTADPPPVDWFLQGSRWDDVRWVFAATTLLEEDRPAFIRWDFLLSDRVRFTDLRLTALRESAKRLLALIRSRSITTGQPQRASTVVGYHSYLRELLRFMHAQGLDRFDDLDEAAIRAFQRELHQRKNHAGALIAPATVQKYLIMLTYLHRFRHEIGDGLHFDPCAGRSAGELAGVHDNDIRRWPYTPDAVALPMIQEAIDFLADNACPLLSARERYAQVAREQHELGFGNSWSDIVTSRALLSFKVRLAGHDRTIDSLTLFNSLIEGLYGACFIVLAYLVGARASEILHWQVGCVQPLEGAQGAAPLIIIRGALFKREPQYHGRPHEWVTPPPAVHAIAVLEALSAPHRLRSGRNLLWLRARGHMLGAREWDPTLTHAVRTPATITLRHSMNRFALLVGGLAVGGKPWRFSTHQGRKTFARFVALRDRSGLFALAQHLGHRERAITDHGYSGNDYRLNREIDGQILEQSVSAWEHMLTTPRLGGRAGAEILAQRPRFHGRRLRQDLKSYARLLVDAGLTLGVCDWGFCVYRQDHSACLGNASGPNPVRREPSTCARCKNFVLSEEHRPYWNAQVLRHEALLNEPALPTQTLKIARERLNEARAMLKSMQPSDSIHRTPA